MLNQLSSETQKTYFGCTGVRTKRKNLSSTHHHERIKHELAADAAAFLANKKDTLILTPLNKLELLLSFTEQRKENTLGIRNPKKSNPTFFPMHVPISTNIYVLCPLKRWNNKNGTHSIR